MTNCVIVDQFKKDKGHLIREASSDPNKGNLTDHEIPDPAIPIERSMLTFDPPA